MESTTHAWNERDLLEQLEWVRGLARSLVRDPGGAEDLVQETWIAASTYRPEVADVPSLRRWLGTVMRHLAIDRVRSSERRTRREAAVARPERTDDDVVARGELHRELATAVLALEEPLRSAILLRYLDGHSTAEVARLQGVSHDAARKRISRGLADLRTRLDDARDGNRGAWIAALQGWLEHGPRAKAASTAVGILAGLRLPLLSALTLAGLLGWFLFGIQSRGTSPETVASALGDAGGASRPGELPSRTTSRAPAALEFELVDERGAPRANFVALLLAGGRCIDSVRSDARGSVTSSAANEPDELLVAREGFEPVRVPVMRDGGRARIVVASRRSVAGSVSRTGAARLGRIELTNDRPNPAQRGLDERARSALAELGIEGERRSLVLPEQGGFAFEGLDESWTGALELPDSWSFRAAPAEGAIEGSSVLLLLQPTLGLQLDLREPLIATGRVIDAQTRQGVALARVRILSLPGEGELQDVRTGTDGRFELRLQRPFVAHEYWSEVLHVDAGGVQSDESLRLAWTELESTRALGEIEIETGRRVRIHVRDEHGADLRGARALSVGMREPVASPATDADGVTCLAGLTPACTELTLAADGFRPRRVTLTGTDTLEVTLAACNRIDIRILGDAGTPDEDIALRVASPSVPFDVQGLVEAGELEGAFDQRFDLDRDGRRVLSSLVPGAQLALSAVGPDGEELVRREVLAPGPGATLEIELRLPPRASAQAAGCSGRVTDTRGRAIPRAQILISNGYHDLWLRSDADGRFDIPPDLCAKRLERVEVGRPGFASSVLNEVDLHTPPLLELVLQPLRALEVSLVDADGRPVEVELVMALVEGRADVGHALEPGRYRFDDLPPGAGRVETDLGGVEFSTPFGALESTTQLKLPATGRLELELGPGSGDSDAFLRVSIQALEREARESYTHLDRGDRDPKPKQLTLVAGRYRLQLEQRTPGRGKRKITRLGAAREIEISAGKTLTLSLP